MALGHAFLRGREYFGDAQSVVSLDDHDFAASDYLVAQQQFDRLVYALIEFDDGAGVQFHQLT